MKKWKNYINGEFIALSTKKIRVINPYTEKKIGEIRDSDKKDIDLAVAAAKKAFQKWKNTSPKERSYLFLRLAELIEKEKTKLANIESQNQGKTIALAIADIEFSIDNLRFFAGACRSLTATSAGNYLSSGNKEKPESLGTSILKREPIGVVAAVTPWNYPFMMACWKLAAVAAGNTIILKPSSSTPLSTLELSYLVEKAGFPKGVINIITGSGEKAGRMLAEHPEVDMISLTGNTETGKEIISLASKSLKKVHLELGGKAPFIVFADADLERAAKMAVESSIINSGQDCTAAARIYVQDVVYEKFITLVKKEAEKIVLGDPAKNSTNLGPLISSKHRERVNSFLKELGKNEKIIFQSDHPRRGFFFPVTVIRDFEQNGNLGQREVFGPIICLAKFTSEEEVINKSNDTNYGLAASVWTENVQKAFRVANALRFGEVWINDHLPLVSEMPHGGLKQSGHSTDLSSHSLEEYTLLKHIYVGLVDK